MKNKLLLVFILLFQVYFFHTITTYSTVSVASGGNVVSQIGERPQNEIVTIGEMKPGQVGYTVPWAYKDGNLGTNFYIHKNRGGTVQLKIICVSPGKYTIDWTYVQ